MWSLVGHDSRSACMLLSLLNGAGDGLLGKVLALQVMRTRVWIPGTHVEARQAWWPACNPSTRNPQSHLVCLAYYWWAPGSAGDPASICKVSNGRRHLTSILGLHMHFCICTVIYTYLQKKYVSICICTYKYKHQPHICIVPIHIPILSISLGQMKKFHNSQKDMC